MPIWHVAWLWRRAVRGIFLDLIGIWSSAHSCLACYTVINPSMLETGRRRILFPVFKIRRLCRLIATRLLA